MSRFKSLAMFHRLALVVTILFIFALSLHISASTRIQETVKRRISLLILYKKEIPQPLEFHELKINTGPVDFDSIFDGANDFLEKMTFEASNRSEKNITFIRFFLYLHTQDSERVKPAVMFPIVYGIDPSLLAPPSFLLHPGETLSVSIPQNKISILREQIKGIESQIVRVGVYAELIGFDDDTVWNLMKGGFIPKPVRTSKELSQGKTVKRPTEAIPISILFDNNSIKQPATLLYRGLPNKLQIGNCPDGCFTYDYYEILVCNYLCSTTRPAWYPGGGSTIMAYNATCYSYDFPYQWECATGTICLPFFMCAT